MNEERVALILTLLIRRCPECPQLEVKDESSKLYGIAGKGPRAVVWLGFREMELRGDGLRGDSRGPRSSREGLSCRGLLDRYRITRPICAYAVHTPFSELYLCV